MHEAVKEKVIDQLKKLWVEHYQGKIDMEDNWITEGRRLITWEIKSPKKTDKWLFSIPLALPFAASLKESPTPIAQHIAEVLNAQAEAGWQFIAENAYVNGYFTPNNLRDYLGSRRLLKEELLLTDEGAYALYRLEMIYQSLVVKGVKPAGEESVLTPTLLERFDHILQLPTSALERLKWAQAIGKLTSEGRLIDLSSEDQSLLMGFMECVIKS